MFDVIIIGGGPGGYKCAELLGKQNLKVGLIEENSIGGVCLNQGCIPFKTYLHASRIRYESKKLSIQKLSNELEMALNQEAILNHKNNIVRGLRQSIEGLLKNCNVDIIYGYGKIVDNQDDIFFIEVNGNIYKSKKIVIASGSKEKKLPENFSFSGIIYSKDILELKKFPNSIMIIGCGVIGLETASYYSDAGTKVTMIESLNHIGGQIDMEIASSLKRILERKGITILTGAKLISADSNSVSYIADGIEKQSKTDYVLCAVGRKPKLDEESLKVLDVVYDESGIKIDSQCRTTNPNVYACGDVTGKLMLAHTAYKQAKVISDNIAGKKSEINYLLIPKVIYTNPEVLSIGFSEEECVEQKIEYTSKSLPMTYSGKYFAENGKDGAKIKMIVDKDKRIIGLHMIGNGASEFSAAAELMLLNRMTSHEICSLIFAHPTYSEIVGDLAAYF